MFTTAMPGGRPTKYTPSLDDQAYNLALLGLTMVEMAQVWDVAESTVYLWQQEHESFSEAIKKGREIADAKVARSLYERACGYVHPEDKLFCHEGQIISETVNKHYPPDPTAIAIWLNNRQPKRWKRNPDPVELDPAKPISVQLVRDTDRTEDAN